MSAALVVIAKDPQPGRSKTRLCPPCTPEEAAGLAAAALADTLEVVMRTPAVRHLLVLDGDPDRWQTPGLEIIPQRSGGLAARLHGAFDDVGQPALLVGMDTPQLTVELLQSGLEALARFDAVLGPALDGGYWSVGLRAAHPEAFVGIPMSAAGTLTAQRSRFAALGLRTHHQPALRDVDTIGDAHAAARIAPRSRFAQRLALCGRLAA